MVKVRNGRVFRSLVLMASFALLLVPTIIVSGAWGGTLNLEVTSAAIMLAIVAAYWLPCAKWIAALAASLMIAVPPFPYWTNWDESRGYFLHFFHGFLPLDCELIIRFCIVFGFAVLLFGVSFRAIGDRREAKP